jgi:hypothetical protein
VALRQIVTLVTLLLVACGGTEAETPPRIRTIRYEVEACCGVERVPEITYTPYWSPDWGPRERVALSATDAPVPWHYTFRSDHLQRGFTVTAYGAIGLECWVFVDGQQVDYAHADNEVSCGARGVIRE